MWDERWLSVLERITFALFVLALTVTLVERAGSVALGLLALIVLGKVADAFFDIDSTAWEIGEDVVITGFVVCVVAYVVVRYRRARA